MPEVGFIGLGAMGSRMVRHVAAHATRTVIYDADTQAAAEVAAQTGATPATSAADFAGLDVVVTMLPTSAIVREALLSWDGGIPSRLAPGAVVIDMSSSQPSQTIALGQDLQPYGVSVVDAPVSGGVPRAESATLSIMMGGDDDAVAKAAPVVSWMSERIFRTGPLGSGHAAKALNNFVAGAATTACFEALTAAERFGIDPRILVDVFNASTGQSFVTTHVLPSNVVDGAYASGFALGLYAKDVAIALGLLEELDVDTAVCNAVSTRLNDALNALGNADHTRAFDYVRELRSSRA